MPMPKAYSPEQGYKWQLFCRHPEYNGREWEHCDYAVDGNDRRHLLANYRTAYPAGYEFKSVLLPRKYWSAATTTPEKSSD